MTTADNPGNDTVVVDAADTEQRLDSSAVVDDDDDNGNSSNNNNKNGSSTTNDGHSDTAVVVEETTKTTDDDDPQEQRRQRRKQRLQKILLQFFLVVPYFVGIVWTISHPILSILTGEMKCRGWYLDENSIDTRFADGKATTPLPSYLSQIVTTASTTPESSSSLCEMISSFEQRQQQQQPQNSDHHFRSSVVDCSTFHSLGLEIAKVVPYSNAIDASEEALVFVIPSPTTTTTTPNSIFHKGVVAALYKLSDPQSTPWLAKTIFVVQSLSDAKNMTTTTTAETIETFLDAYSGRPGSSDDDGHDYTRNPSSSTRVSLSSQLPPSWSTAIIRTVIVLEVEDTSTMVNNNNNNRQQRNGSNRNSNNGPFSGSVHIQLRPQGRRGTLPNADLVFLVGMLLEKTSFMNTRMYPNSTFLTHGYVNEYHTATTYIDQIATNIQQRLQQTPEQQQQQPNNKKQNTAMDYKIRQVKIWATNLVNLALFVRTMAVGPYPPHANALDRGIDSLTLSVRLDGEFRPGGKHPSLELVQFMMEYLIRALSNLHERLHHSQALYLLPSPKMFVSHMEYFLPNILVLLPLAVRAFGFLLPKMIKGGIFDLPTVGGSIIMSLLVIIAIGNPDDDNANDKTSASMRLLYLAVALFWIRRLRSIPSSSMDGSNQDQKEKVKDTNHNDDDDDDSNNKSIKDNEQHQHQQLENMSEEEAKGQIIRTLQFVSCVLAAYILVPIAFAHTSLSYVPSLLWGPLLAFPDYSNQSNTAFNQLKSFGLMCIVVLTAPPMLLVPLIFDKYTPFVQFAYAPIHLHYFVLVVLSIFR